ncbi:MAG: HDOD domain-containing protein [Oscillospiraceae bacterium]|nr:HDOD domain-containing protein [Oscillospiraceae bacterium]
MDLLVVPKPIFSRAKEVFAYYLSFQVGNALLEGGKTYAFENDVNTPFFDFVNKTGLEALTSNKLIFIPVTNVHLALELETICKADRSLVALLMGSHIELSPNNLQRITRFRELGFKTAFIHRTDYEELESFFPQTDYIFNNNDTAAIPILSARIKKTYARTKIIARGVNNDTSFNKAVVSGAELLQGDFYKNITVSRDNRISPLKVNYISLLNQVNQDDFELDKFAGVVQRDTALAIQFLKMVNSSHVKGTTITSLRHAASMLGQKEIKKWVTTAVTSTLGEESPGEVTRLSMIRAKFCENLAPMFEMAVHKDNLFLMGLFSVLNIILETSIEQALQIVQVPEKVKVALLGGENDFAAVYRFIQLYEEGEWTEVSRIALINHMKIKDIFNAYNDALEWYGRLIAVSATAEPVTE